MAGCFNIAVHYENGWGVKRDIARAARFYAKACDG